jgi:WD40 repeat protein
LTGQLIGRLLGNKTPSIQVLLKHTDAGKAWTWLRPLNRNLTAPGGSLIRTLYGHTNAVNAVAVTPDGCRAISASWDRTLRLWDLATGQTIHTLQGHSDLVNAAAVTPDSRRAVSASRDQTLRLWDLGTGQTIRPLEGHSAAVNDAAVTPDGRCAVSASDDRTLRLWDLGTGQTIRTLQGHADRVNAVALVRLKQLWNMPTGTWKSTTTHFGSPPIHGSR